MKKIIFNIIFIISIISSVYIIIKLNDSVNRVPSNTVTNNINQTSLINTSGIYVTNIREIDIKVNGQTVEGKLFTFPHSVKVLRIKKIIGENNHDHILVIEVIK